MTPTLRRYLTKLFLSRLALLLVGVNFLVVILDFMANGDDVISSNSTPLLSSFRYMGLRLPQIMSTLMPFVLLIAVLLTLMELVRHQEMAAMMSAGMSQLKVMLTLLPAGMIIAVLQFAISDQLEPRAIKELKNWGVGEYKVNKEEETNAIWFHHQGDIIRVGRVERGDLLHDITIFRRGQDENIVERIHADRLVHQDGTWILSDVSRSTITRLEPEHLDRLEWQSNLQPRLVASLASHPKNLSVFEIRRFWQEARFGSFPNHVYEVWMHRKIVAPLVLFVMVLLSVPLVQRYQRHANLVSILAFGLAAGFSFIVFDDLLMTLGEAGLIPPILAAWAATLIFAAIGATLALHRESL